MKPSLIPILHHCLRAGLGALFVLSGISKLADVPAFAEQVGGFGIVFDDLVLPTAWSVCLLEIVLGSALAANLRGSLVSIAVLLCVFVATLTYGVWLGLDIECGCFGPGYHVSLKTQLAMDAGLFLWCGLVHLSRVASNIQTQPVTKLLSNFHQHRDRPNDAH